MDDDDYFNPTERTRGIRGDDDFNPTRRTRRIVDDDGRTESDDYIDNFYPTGRTEDVYLLEMNHLLIVAVTYLVVILVLKSLDVELIWSFLPLKSLILYLLLSRWMYISQELMSFTHRKVLRLLADRGFVQL